MTLVISYVQASRDAQLQSLDVSTNGTFESKPGSMFSFQSVTILDGLLVALILFVMETLRALFYSAYFAIAYRMGMRLRSGLLALVMKKVMRLRGGRGANSGEVKGSYLAPESNF